MGTSSSNNKTIKGGTGITAGGDVTFGDVSGQVAISNGQVIQIKNINVQGMSEKQAREIISSQLDPILNEIVRQVRQSTKLTQEQQMTYESIKEKVNEADRWFDEILGTPNTYLSLGNIEYDRQNYEKAIEYYNKSIKIEIRNVSAWFNKAFALHSLERYGEAIGCYDKVLEIDPEHVGVWYNKGTALHNLGRYGEAIGYYDKALEIDPEHAGAWSNKAFALHNLGKYGEAIGCYDKALEMEPGHIRMWYNKGLISHNLGRYSEAVRCYDKVLEIDPEYANVWYHKAFALHNLGRYREAIKYYDKVLEIDPKHKLAKKNRGIAKKLSEKNR